LIAAVIAAGSAAHDLLVEYWGLSPISRAYLAHWYHCDNSLNLARENYRGQKLNFTGTIEWQNLIENN
jgi:hypothetical protein